MKIFYPSYYKEFKCIADRCKHSCCIGWEIGVDKRTLSKYTKLPPVESAGVLSHIDDDGCIMLSDGERCPFLCDSGLCRLISTYGEEYISHICREHPRFYHRVGNRVECGIGASCEEACRVILSSDFESFYSLERDEAEIAEETDFETLPHRELIYAILLDSNLSYREKLAKIKEQYNIDNRVLSAESICEAFSGLEYLDSAHREIMAVGGSDNRSELHPYFERFFAYLIFRHLTVAESYDGLRARLAFCLLLLSVLENAALQVVANIENLCEIARIISEEIEYSEDNTASLIFEFESIL